MFQLMSLCQKVVCCVLGDVTVSDSCLCLRWGQSVRELFVVFQVTSLCQTVAVACVSGDVTVSVACVLGGVSR